MRCIDCGKYPFCKNIDNPQKTDCKNYVNNPLNVKITRKTKDGRSEFDES